MSLGEGMVAVSLLGDELALGDGIVDDGVDDDEVEGAVEDGALDEGDEGAMVVDELEGDVGAVEDGADDVGGGLVVLVSRWHPAAPAISASASTTEAERNVMTRSPFVDVPGSAHVI